MLDQNQLTPEEAQEQNQLLIQDLRRYYHTQAQDTASLSRIHARLLEKTATSLPVNREQEAFQPPLQLHTPHRRNAKKHLRQALAEDRPRNTFLATVAAALLLVVLVGSFALLLHHGNGTGATRPGWILVAKFSGTGSQTITRQHIELGRKFALFIICTNTQEGEVAITFDIGNSSSTCQTHPNTFPGSEGYALPVKDFPPIRTIEVTTNATTSWELLFYRGTYYPPLGFDSANWQPITSETVGSGNATWTLGGIAWPRALALIFACHGTGDIQISLQPNDTANSLKITPDQAPCNGQTSLGVSDTPVQSGSLIQVLITTSAENDWQVLLIGCTNGKPNCGLRTVLSTRTPGVQTPFTPSSLRIRFYPHP